ncbi:hypothetical protein BTH42_01360 [Burkholderia sp. SRS-W-2-2016]|uniref:hypothetical protein n=1 Tax=Burkholderia sp. SRS-W-2-2016 TaxID=1926878 RepID=UPI00094AC352|nr:hypothetical protein [Burkholderia sp. SRS-W-2-2016]OLL33384.1 hypothetical protein BTH42_01360 [Burkholderia sp. SRS-W-2-2016]
MDVISVSNNDTRVGFHKASVISLQKFNDYFYRRLHAASRARTVSNARMHQSGDMKIGARALIWNP